MQNSGLAIVVLIAALIVLLWALYRLGEWIKGRGGLVVTIYEWEHGLRYVNGSFDGVLPPGRYLKWSGFARHDIFALRRTEQFDPSPQVDVTSKDGLVFRMSAMIGYRIIDPRQAYEEGHLEKIRIAASAGLVKLAATYDLQQLLSDRAAAQAELKSLLDQRMHGCEITSVAIHAITLPPEVRRLFAEVERAKLEGIAALERARGENAALRSLTNAAGMLKGNPELMNLRLLQSMSAPSGKNQLTIVLGREGLIPGGDGPVTG